VAGVFHIINHATFKASLFMAAGIIDHETGTRDMRRINGLWRYMPHTAPWPWLPLRPWPGCRCSTAFCPRRCFLPKPCTSVPGLFQPDVPAAATLAGIFAVAYSARFIHDVFFQRRTGEPAQIPATRAAPLHEDSRWRSWSASVCWWASSPP
jgi:multicomponent K+:H+ antiporter subunit A